MLSLTSNMAVRKVVGKVRLVHIGVAAGHGATHEVASPRVKSTQIAVVCVKMFA